jgi:hypothetical protein
MTICSSGGGYFPQHSACFRIKFFYELCGVATGFRVECFMEDTGFSGFSGVSGIRTLALRFTQPSMATRLNLREDQSGVFCNATKCLRNDSVDGGCVVGWMRADPEAAASVRDTAE